MIENILSGQVMLTTRNIFIANLAVSDLFLCAFTMPLTLVDLVTKYWSLGPDQVSSYLPCKYIGALSPYL
jgi:neuropeptide Y receptor